MLKVRYPLFIFCINLFFVTKCIDEDLLREAELRATIAHNVIIKTYTPSKNDAHYAFSSILKNSGLRPFLISIVNNSDATFMFSKRYIGLKLTPDDQIYSSDTAFFIPGLMLFMTGCLDNIYIKTISVITSLAMLWKDYHEYMFFKSMLLTDDGSVFINAHEQIQRIVVVDDHDFKGAFTLYLENIQAGYFQDFYIDIVQNGCADRCSVMLDEANYV